MQEKLNNIACLSRFYGSNPDCVFLGGGNTSVKTEDSLYIKPSGVALATIQPEQYLQVDRQQLSKLFDTPLPDNSQIREAFAKTMLESAVRPLGAGRPSVETPLHTIINYTYIVHLHPALVNGMTCAVNGPETARRLFPEALWIDYCDAGCKLAFVAKEALDKDTAARGHQPQVIFLQNHGVFVGADTPEEINQIYDHMFSVLAEEYRKAGIPVEPPSLGEAETSDVVDLAPAFRQLLADDQGNRPIVYTAGCTLPYAGPLTPDHIVYAKSFAYVGEANRQDLETFKRTYGYLPKVIGVPGKALFTVGSSIKEAKNVAIAVANALQVQRLADAFGGPKYMTPREYQFIENWEVESYRRSVANAGKTPKRLDHKVAVLTGATLENGAALARELVRNGAILAVADQQEDTLNTIASDLCQTFGTDIAFPVPLVMDNEHSIANMLDEVTRICGGLDLMIVHANAPQAGNLKALPLQDWNRAVNANLTPYFLCLKHASRIMGRQMQDRKGKATDIIQLSQLEEQLGLQNNAATVAAQAAAVALTSYAAHELEPDNIKVNTICVKHASKTAGDTHQDLACNVAKAIIYCVEQPAETGQSLTVSRG